MPFVINARAFTKHKMQGSLMSTSSLVGRQHTCDCALDVTMLCHKGVKEKEFLACVLYSTMRRVCHNLPEASTLTCPAPPAIRQHRSRTGR